MQVTRITVSSSRKVPHPTLEFASLSSFVSMEAELGEDQQIHTTVRELQETADHYLDEHIGKLTGDRRIAQHKPTPINRVKEATDNTAARLAEKHGAKQ